MRSLLIATAICAALSITGCSFTISGPCTSLSHQSRINGDCGCQEGNACDTCGPQRFGNSWQSQSECGSVNFGEGAPCGLEGISVPSAPRLGWSKLGGNAAACDGGCGGGCDGGCSGGCDGGCGGGDCGCGQTGRGGKLGLGLFDRGSECSDEIATCSNNGLLGNGIRGGRMQAAASRIASHDGGLGGRGLINRGDSGLGDGGFGNQVHDGGLAARLHNREGRGCGRFGCGREGRMCLSCRAKGAGLFGRSTEEIPHTAQPPGPGAGAAPQYVYPYYTTRGPRDFLMANPPSIGY